MIVLRPHHLLCTFAYRGKGYSPTFVANFDHYLAQLHEPGAEITLQQTNDVFCQACPQQASATHCQTEQHIQTLDSAVLATFGLETGLVYRYQDVQDHLLATMTPEKFRHCCQTCSWYEFGICEPIWCSQSQQATPTKS